MRSWPTPVLNIKRPSLPPIGHAYAVSSLVWISQLSATVSGHISKWWNNVGMFPSPQFRQCTSDLKRGPIDKFIRSLPHKVILNCIGIRAEESNPRSRLAPLTKNQPLSTQRRTVYNWLPIFDRSLSDVLAWHWANAIRLHPVYVPEYHKDGTTGGYLRRFSCRVCIFSTDADLAAIYLHDRAAFEMIAGLEHKLNFTMRPGASLMQIVEAHLAVRDEQAQQQSFCF